MKIAVLSDIHDNFDNLEKALKEIKRSQCDIIIFCGDFGGPAIAKKLAEAKLKTYAVFGNVDGAIYEITTYFKENAPHVTLFRDMGFIEIDNKKIAFCHYPEFAEGLAHTRKYDVVFHGHTHIPDSKKIENTLLCCPGEIIGYKTGKVTFGIFDTKTGQFIIKEVQ